MQIRKIHSLSPEDSMGDDDLDTVVREGVRGLRQYINLLEALLSSARAAEALFPSAVASLEAVSRETPVAMAQDLEPVDSPAPYVSEYGEDYERLKSALLAQKPSGYNRVLEGLRVIAAAGGGELDFGLTCLVLRHTEISRGSAENVASYVNKRLRTSEEFQRVGEPGSGKYRWLLYPGEHSENVSASATDDCGGLDYQETG